MNVLIIEDDFRIGEMYKEYLLSNTNVKHVESVINATTAMEYLKEHLVDIVVIDIYLPDMMGDKLVENILKKYPYTNFICISANQDSVIIKNLIKLGILYYLVKPVKLEKLGEIVDQFLDMDQKLSNKTDISQEQIDKYFTNTSVLENNVLPKGIDPVSLEKIQAAFQKKNEWSSAQLGEELGTSRTTVRRYLEYLREQDYLTVTQEFGDKGRPEKIYRR